MSNLSFAFIWMTVGIIVMTLLFIFLYLGYLKKVPYTVPLISMASIAVYIIIGMPIVMLFMQAVAPGMFTDSAESVRQINTISLIAFSVLVPLTIFIAMKFVVNKTESPIAALSFGMSAGWIQMILPSGAAAMISIVMAMNDINKRTIPVVLAEAQKGLRNAYPLFMGIEIAKSGTAAINTSVVRQASIEILNRAAENEISAFTGLSPYYFLSLGMDAVILLLASVGVALWALKAWKNKRWFALIPIAVAGNVLVQIPAILRPIEPQPIDKYFLYTVFSLIIAAIFAFSGKFIQKMKIPGDK